MSRNENDQFGVRMKAYEQVYTDVRIPPDEWLCVRIDGRTFSRYTKGFEKPFDVVLTNAMIETMKHLVQESHVRIGYTQSDEITLISSIGEKATEHMFGGKVSKLNSVLASIATAKFNQHTEGVFAHERILRRPDCRTEGCAAGEC